MDKLEAIVKGITRVRVDKDMEPNPNRIEYM